MYFCQIIVKFMFSKKATEIDKIFTFDLTLCSKCQIHGEDFINLCGLLRKHELYQTYQFMSSVWLNFSPPVLSSLLHCKWAVLGWKPPADPKGSLVFALSGIRALLHNGVVIVLNPQLFHFCNLMSFSSHFRNLVFGCFGRTSYQDIT